MAIKTADNKAADALSRLPIYELMQMTLTSVHSNLVQELQDHWNSDPHLTQLITELQDDATSHSNYSWDGRLLTR